jgi:hypothetical protein
MLELESLNVYFTNLFDHLKLIKWGFTGLLLLFNLSLISLFWALILVQYDHIYLCGNNKNQYTHNWQSSYQQDVSLWNLNANYLKYLTPKHKMWNLTPATLHLYRPELQFMLEKTISIWLPLQGTADNFVQILWYKRPAALNKPTQHEVY